MNPTCRNIKKQLGRWFELADHEKETIRSHARNCLDCRRELVNVENVLQLLDQKTSAYHQIRYAGPMPSAPDHIQAAQRIRFPPAPFWAMAATLATLVLVSIWFGEERKDSKGADKFQPASIQFSIPALPARPSRMKILSLGTELVNQQIQKPTPKIGPSMRGSIPIPRMPERPTPGRRWESDPHSDARI